MRCQLHCLSLKEAPLLQDLAAIAVIDDVKLQSPKLSIDLLVSALPFLKHAFDSSNQLIRECAAAIISKLASTSARPVVIGCLPVLVDTLEGSSVQTLAASDSACHVVAHAADAMHSLFKHNTTRPLAAATAGVVSALVNVLGNSVGIDLNHRISALHTNLVKGLGSNADRDIARSTIAWSARAGDSTGKVQVAVTAALHALAKESAHRQALAAEGGVRGLVAALKSDCLAFGAKYLAELAFFELAQDPATTAVVIDQGGAEYCVETLTSLLHETHEASTPHWRKICEDEWEAVFTRPEWRRDDPTVVSAIIAAKVVNFSSALPEGRVRLTRSPHALQAMKHVFKFSSDIDGGPADIIFEQLAMTMLRLRQGQESRVAIERPPLIQTKVDAGINEQQLKQALRDCFLQNP